MLAVQLVPDAHTRPQLPQLFAFWVTSTHWPLQRVSKLPQPVVTQYHLSPDERYVSTNGYIYVVDPSNYTVTRVITVPGG